MIDATPIPRDASTAADGDRPNLFGCTRDELRAWVTSQGQPLYRGDQLFNWLYHKRVTTFDAMSNMSKVLRGEFAGRADIRRPSVAIRRTSTVDDTVKYLFELDDGERIESVLMRDGARTTVCVSSQVGCSQGCTFCATAQIGLKRNMTTGEILGQIAAIEDDIGVGAVTNVVFMGMGEPLANYKNLIAALRILSSPDGFCISARRITVSTSGLLPAIERFTSERLKAGLALSLNATTDDVRNVLIPSNRRYTIEAVLNVCRRWTQTTGRRLTVEYVLLDGMNDSLEDARRLIRMLRTIPSKVNLIPFNPVENTEFRQPSATRVEAFQRELSDAHVVATVRNTKGRDIAAACGQLRASLEYERLPLSDLRLYDSAR
jgi:23S rRNA (adenine2503-C2)-methyltransferase